jgi:hypothetical protein
MHDFLRLGSNLLSSDLISYGWENLLAVRARRALCPASPVAFLVSPQIPSSGVTADSFLATRFVLSSFLSLRSVEALAKSFERTPVSASNEPVFAR